MDELEHGMIDFRELDACFAEAIADLEQHKGRLAQAHKDWRLTYEQRDEVFAAYQSTCTGLAVQKWLRSNFWVLRPAMNI